MNSIEDFNLPIKKFNEELQNKNHSEINDLIEYQLECQQFDPATIFKALEVLSSCSKENPLKTRLIEILNQENDEKWCDVKVILENKNIDENIFLQHAVLQEDVNFQRLLINHGICNCQKGNDFIEAAKNGELTKELIEENILYIDYMDGWATPLMWAVHNNQIDIAKFPKKL